MTAIGSSLVVLLMPFRTKKCKRLSVKADLAIYGQALGVSGYGMCEIFMHRHAFKMLWR